MKPGIVLVPLDGSRLAEAALAAAIGFTREGATLILVRAAKAATFREAELYLADVAERLQRVGVKDVETLVCRGAPAERIADAAQTHKADLIVMSTHGRGGLARLVLGSVAERVLCATSTPALLFRPDRRAGATGPAHHQDVHWR